MDMEKIKKSINRQFPNEDIYDVEVSEFTSDEANFKILKVHFDKSEMRTFYLKQSKYSRDTYNMIRERNLNEYRGSVEADRIMTSTYPGSTINMVDIYPEGCSILSEDMQGVMFAKLINPTIRVFQNNKEFRDVCQLNYQVGEWLKNLHDSTLSDEDNIRHEDILEYNMDRLDRLNNVAIFTNSGGDKDKILATIKKLLEQVAPSDFRKCFTHGDFAPFNIVISKGRIIVVDFADQSYNSPFLDLTYYCNSLDEYRNKIYISNKKVNILKENFLRGYKIGSTDHPLFKIYMIQAILCKLVGFLQGLESRGYQFWSYKRKILFYLKRLQMYMGPEQSK